VACRWGSPPAGVDVEAMPLPCRSNSQDGGGYRRDHLRAHAQRVEVADKEVRIMGSKSDLLRTIRAYEYRDAATLLADFWTTVDAVLRERGVIP